jgi:ATP/maltotriose-dependent transcriptional regulator MalT
VLGLVRLTWVGRDLGETIEQARRGLQVAREVPEAAVAALASLGLLLYFSGEVDEASAVTHEALDRPEAMARPHGFVAALATLSMLETDAGRPEAAEERAREAVEAATQVGVDQSASGGAARVALASALAAQGRLSEAEREAVRGAALRRQSEPEAAHLHALLVLARIRAERGRLSQAAADLAEARRGIEAFADAGRLQELAAAVESVLAEHAAVSTLAEPLGESELNVLTLLATDLSRREIGARLYLSVNTVKTHTQSLYRKLGVTSRDQAVERATALGLLDSDSPG